MRFMRFHRAFVVAVVVVALAAGLASAHGGAAAQAPATDTVTMPLQPGWNLIGWMGPDTTAADLFAAIPALRVVAAWDDEAGRYQWVRRGGTVPAALARGQGLFLWVGGTRSVQWTRPASVEGMLLTLPSGYSLVGWAGLDGTPIAEAVGRFGDALVGASRWNAETQSYERYEPGAEEPADGMPVLQHGDALWVELSEEARWWQSGTERTRFVFEAPVTQERKSELRDEMERVVAFFAERYGIEPPDFVVRVDPEGDDTYASRGLIHLGPDRVHDRSIGFVLAHEYFHVLQFYVSRQHPSANGSPAWLTEGTAQYATDLYWRDRRGDADDRVRVLWWRESLSLDERLPALEGWQPFYATGDVGYWLGALAVDWLVRHAAALSDNAPFTPLEPGGLELREEWDAHFEYYQLRRSSYSWQAAFKEAFGISVDDFYTAFEEYRTALIAARLPHLADDVDAPILVFEGEIAADTAARIRAQFDSVQALIRERFRGGPTDYTVFFAADAASAAAAHLRVSGGELEEGRCGSWQSHYYVMDLACQPRAVSYLTWNHFTRVVERLAPRDSLPPAVGSWQSHYYVMDLACQPRAVSYLTWNHFTRVVERLAPRDSLPPAVEGYREHGAGWLINGLARYVEAVSRETAGIETLVETRNRNIVWARQTGQPLRNVETSAGSDAVGRPIASALSFLAGEWLAELVGEPVLFDYYRLLPISDSWQEAFEGAFGIAVEEFYHAFEAYRSEVAPPLPHLADDVDEPILVLVGEVSAEAAEPYRTKLRVLQTLFRERFGAELADYTLYIAADSELAAAAYLRALGRELQYFGCSQGEGGILLIQVVGCSVSPDPVPRLHHDAVVRELTPWESLPPALSGYTGLGPSWLQTATRTYAGSAYLAVTGTETFEGIRSGFATLASQTELPLRNMETYGAAPRPPYWVGRALSFLAADWLAERAGEPALFEYYRLLPTSDSWQEAFEGAFGITIDDFYAAFEDYRAAGFTS